MFHLAIKSRKELVFLRIPRVTQGLRLGLSDRLHPKESVMTMDDNKDLAERVHALETAQAVAETVQSGAEATQAATQAGASATTAAAHAGTWSTMAGSAAGLIVGIFLGLAIAKA
jgi:hypothetical protein